MFVIRERLYAHPVEFTVMSSKRCDLLVACDANKVMDNTNI